MRDMTRDARCAEAEAVVREQRAWAWQLPDAPLSEAPNGEVEVISWDNYLTVTEDLERLQAAVMGETKSRGRDESKSHVEVEGSHAGVIRSDDGNAIGEFFPVDSPEWQAANSDPSVSALYVQETE